MDGKERREGLISCLQKASSPITGTHFAKQFGVSRQVIVQDVALLRAQGKQVISTSEGYLLYNIKTHTFKRVIPVKHDENQIEDELTTIIDLGGTILNAIVVHPVYGQISVDMMLDSRISIYKFMDKLEQNDFVPLMTLTEGEHYHTIEATSEDVLDHIENALKTKGYLNIQ